MDSDPCQARDASAHILSPKQAAGLQEEFWVDLSYTWHSLIPGSAEGASPLPGVRGCPSLPSHPAGRRPAHRNLSGSQLYLLTIQNRVSILSFVYRIQYTDLKIKSLGSEEMTQSFTNIIDTCLRHIYIQYIKSNYICKIISIYLTMRLNYSI